ncbi:MAG: GAF domain-containing protein [Bdellovibrionales bacterium]|nr:GAF domain-containing protein [Bdellovibrionales bacterium]
MSRYGIAEEFNCLRKQISSAESQDEVLRRAADFISDYLQADFVEISLGNQSIMRHASRMKEKQGDISCIQFEVRSGDLWFRAAKVELPFFCRNRDLVAKNRELVQGLEQANVLSYALIPIYEQGSLSGYLSIGFLTQYYHWRMDEMIFLQHLADFIAMQGRERYGAQKEKEADSITKVRQLSEQVLRQGNLIIIRTDHRFRIVDFVGDTERFFGVSKSEVLEREDVWADFLDVRDLRRLNLRLARMKTDPHEFSEEVRISRGQDHTDVRWIMLRAVPRLSEEGQLLGWEGYGVDITEKRHTEIELRSQRKRIEALYEVSRAVRFNLDPALVALKGLRALTRATNSDAGFACFYDKHTSVVEMMASEGLSAEYLEAVTDVIDGKSLVRYAIENEEGMLLDNIQLDERASIDVAKIEDLKSTIVMPLIFEELVLGAIVLFCHKASRYSVEDFDLVAAAANQIALAASQAEFYTQEKRQADSLAVLYKLSHELSKLFTPSEVAEQSFSLIQKELACKRMWLGVLNEQGTHIIGQNGVGPGVRSPLRDVQIELALQHDFLDEALETKQPVIVESGQKMNCAGLDRVIERLQLGTFVIVPLVSLGQIVGVFLIEPSVSSPSFIRRKLPLLTAMATEIASVILARRFESKMADADKMRMAAVLASGVAHNFNNLLQAVMGQASLIEMQLPDESPVRESAKTIIEAAGKGAGLVKHLLGFSSQGHVEKRELSLSSFLQNSKDLYSSMLGGSIFLQFDIPDDSSKVLADENQIQQIITNLLMNSREAIGDKPKGSVTIRLRQARLRSGEVDPELAPGPYVRIDIEDNGIGMDEERRARCFEPFYSTKDLDSHTGISLTGSGLGLSSAYSISRQHNGAITVTSVPGEGTVFSVYLPVHDSEELIGAKRRIQQPDVPCVVVLDDFHSESRSLQAAFQSFGLQCEIVQTKEDAYASLSSHESDVELITVDLDKMREKAHAFINDIHSLKQNVTILFTTIERARWQKIFAKVENVAVIEKPLGVWAIQSILRELYPGLVRSRRLTDSIEVQRVDPKGEEHGSEKKRKPSYRTAH